MSELPWVTRQDLQELLNRVSSLEMKLSSLQIQFSKIQYQNKELTPNEVKDKRFDVSHSYHTKN